MKEETDNNDILNYLEFIKYLLVDTQTPPCEGCPFRNHCRNNDVACYEFYTYARYGRFKPLKAINAPAGIKYNRTPSYKWYREVFITSKLHKDVD